MIWFPFTAKTLKVCSIFNACSQCNVRKSKWTLTEGVFHFKTNLRCAKCRWKKKKWSKLHCSSGSNAMFTFHSHCCYFDTWNPLKMVADQPQPQMAAAGSTETALGKLKEHNKESQVFARPPPNSPDTNLMASVGGKFKPKEDHNPQAWKDNPLMSPCQILEDTLKCSF